MSDMVCLVALVMSDEDTKGVAVRMGTVIGIDIRICAKTLRQVFRLSKAIKIDFQGLVTNIGHFVFLYLSQGLKKTSYAPI